MTHQNLTTLVQSHLALELYDYSLVIKWALNLLEKGIENENVLILASLSKNTERQEVRPYLTAALDNLNIEEYSKENAVFHYARVYCYEIIEEADIRDNLNRLYKLCLEYDHEFDLSPFYFLHFAWEELDELGVNFYWQGVTLGNIEATCIEQAKLWLSNNPR